VTNVGPAHLEGFGSIERVRKTDLEILGHVGTACVNADDLFLMDGVKDFKGKLTTYGIDHRADVYARGVVQGERGSHFRLFLPGKGGVQVELMVPGRFNVLNALGAAAVANEMGIDVDAIKQGLESFAGVPMRLEIREMSGLLVISDVYNANPASVEGALMELLRLKRKRTIAVLGDMLELGAYSVEEHLKIVRTMSRMNIDVFIAVGEEMARAAGAFAGECYTAEDSVKAGSIFSSVSREGDTVLIKGSRGMRMERVLENAGDPAAKGAGHAV
jgi:UDP-N-acetylmuramoyl-tripeptide--D-alanyl-D-alanine ligase